MRGGNNFFAVNWQIISENTIDRSSTCARYTKYVEKQKIPQNLAEFHDKVIHMINPCKHGIFYLYTDLSTLSTIVHNVKIKKQKGKSEQKFCEVVINL